MDSEPTRSRSRSGGRDIAAPKPGWKYFAEAQAESVVTERGENGTIRFDNCLYLRVDPEAEVNDILRDLRIQAPTLLLMVCSIDLAAEVWGPAPSQKKCPNFRGGAWPEKSRSHRSLLDFSGLACL